MSTSTISLSSSPPTRPPAELVRDANLPPELAAIVLSVTDKTKLWKREQSEVARELVNHFAEALANGATPADLASSFGDPTQAAKLIARSTKRNRPLAWRAMRNTLRAFGWLILAIIIVYILLCIRYATGEPVLSKNYFAEFNKPALSVPAEQRAWPLYRRAFLDIPPLRDDKWAALSNNWPHFKPTDPEWPLFLEYLQTNQPHIARIRDASNLPHSAFIAGPDELTKRESVSDPAGIEPPPADLNPPTIGILLPQLGIYRNFARLLTADIHAAAARNDGPTITADLHAMLRLAGHSTEDRTLIAQLVGLAILELTNRTAANLLNTRPELFTDDDLRSLAHAFAAYKVHPGATSTTVDLTIERWMFEDMVHRCYTDDGNGNGHFVGPESEFYREFGFRKPDLASKAVGPIASAALLNRKDTVKLYDEIMNAAMASYAMPPSTREHNAEKARRDALANDTLGFRYLFINTVLPAINRAQQNTDFTLQRRDAITTALAIELYKRHHNAPPTTLADLVPTYLPAVPLDRWSGRAMGYLPQGNAFSNNKPILYSVGMDQTDDHATIGCPFEPDAAHIHINWPAQTGDLPTKDWIIFPIIEPTGERPVPRADQRAPQNSTDDLTRALFPWASLNGL